MFDVCNRIRIQTSMLSSSPLLKGLSARDLRARTFGLIWVAAPKWTIAWSVLLIAQGLLPLAAVYLLKLLVNSLVKAANSGGDWSQLRPTFILIALTVAVMLLTEVLQSASELVRIAQSELVQAHQGAVQTIRL